MTLLEGVCLQELHKARRIISGVLDITNHNNRATMELEVVCLKLRNIIKLIEADAE